MLVYLQAKNLISFCTFITGIESMKRKHNDSGNNKKVYFDKSETLVLSVHQVANLFGVTERSVMGWAKKRDLPKLGHGQYDLKAVWDWAVQNLIVNRNPVPLQGVREEYWKWKAENERLKVEQAQGRLVDAEGIESAAFNSGRRVRDSILLVPSRISAIVAAMSDEYQVNQCLTRELKQALESLAGQENDHERS